MLYNFNDGKNTIEIVEINKKYPRLSEFIQHVIQPSLKIDDQLASYTVVTVEGQVVSGLIVKRTDMELTVKTSEKKLGVRPPYDPLG